MGFGRRGRQCKRITKMKRGLAGGKLGEFKS